MMKTDKITKSQIIKWLKHNALAAMIGVTFDLKSAQLVNARGLAELYLPIKNLDSDYVMPLEYYSYPAKVLGGHLNITDYNIGLTHYRDRVCLYLAFDQ